MGVGCTFLGVRARMRVRVRRVGGALLKRTQPEPTCDGSALPLRHEVLALMPTVHDSYFNKPPCCAGTCSFEFVSKGVWHDLIMITMDQHYVPVKACNFAHRR